jgi:putative DNA primase/helicase
MTTLAEIVGSYVPLTMQGAECKGNCPFCQSEKTLFVNGSSFKCYACDSGGDGIEFISLKEGVSAETAAERIATGTFNATIAKPDTPPPLPRLTSLPPDDAGDPPVTHRLYGSATLTPVRNATGQRIAYLAQYPETVKVWTWGGRQEPFAWGIGSPNRPMQVVGLDKLAIAPTKAVLIVFSVQAFNAAATLLSAYAAVTFMAHWSKADLEPLRGRRGIIWPKNTPESVEMAGKLAETLSVLEFQAQILDPNGADIGADLQDFAAWGGDKVREWAKPRLKTYAAVTVLAPRPVAAPPQLGVVEGNTIRKPKQSDGDDDAEKGPLALSDSHLAGVFAVQHGENWKYVPDWSSSDVPCWFEWVDGFGWRRDVVKAYWPQVEQICINAAYTSEGKTLTPDARRKLQGAGKYQSVISCVKYRRELVRESSVFDTDKMLLGIPGGFVDLADGKIYDADKSKLITLRTSIVPVAGEHPLFDKVMLTVANCDPDTLEYLWRWLGYICTGLTNEERFLYLHADEGAGKGTLTKAVSQILGGYADSIPIDALVEQKHVRHSQEWAKLQNKRLVTSSEGDGASRLNEALVKRVTGGDIITARAMRMNDVSWYPHFKLVMDGNGIPRLSGESGMNRRLDLVEFAAVPESERDTTLKTRIVSEYSAILHSMIAACLRYQREGLAKPEAVAATSKEYIDSQDALGAWMDALVIRDTGERIKTSAAYLSYSNYVKSNNGHPFGNSLFTQRMKAKGFTLQKSGVNYFVGLTVKGDDMYGGAPKETPPYGGADDDMPVDF